MKNYNTFITITFHDDGIAAFWGQKAGKKIPWPGAEIRLKKPGLELYILLRAGLYLSLSLIDSQNQIARERETCTALNIAGREDHISAYF